VEVGANLNNNNNNNNNMRMANRWPGTWQLFVQRQTLTLIWQFKVPARWLSWPPLARKPSRLCCVADSSHFPADRSENTGSHQWVCARISGRLVHLGRRISVLSGDDREHLFLFQRISVAIQRTPYCCTTVFPLRTTRTSFSTSNLFVLFLIFPTLVLYDGLKK